MDSKWLNAFWLSLARNNHGVRVQIHTHPGEAFHSLTDDTYPIIHTPGFLSLVIPNFATGPVWFKDAFLTELQSSGHWEEVSISERFVLT